MDKKTHKRMEVVTQGLGRRAGIMKWAYRLREKRELTFSEIRANALCLPATWRMKRYCSQVNGSGSLKTFRIHGGRDIVAFPKNTPRREIAQVMVETFQKDNWHRFERGFTRVENGDIVVDCGASEGLFAISVLDRAQKVFCIEPQDYYTPVYKYLLKRTSKIELLKYALGNEPGDSFLEGIGFEAHLVDIPTGPDFQEVEVTTIDKLFFDEGQSIDFLKADIEGAEQPMIEGALKTIEAFKPKIVVTTYHHENDPEEIIRIIKETVPEYRFEMVGVEHFEGKPITVHFWIDAKHRK